jgi:hypothetical protein
MIVNEVLQESFNRRLYNLKHDDELRLLTLYAWRDRYKVSIKWMLKLLIPIWSKKFARFKIKSSLGCRVATLVGKKSEEIIRERLWRDFPHGENKDNWRQTEQDKIIKSLGKNDSKTRKTKTRFANILEAPNPETFIKQYRRELKWKKSTNNLNHNQNKQLKEIKQKQYRMNPWME